MLRFLNLAFRLSPLLLPAYWIALFVATHLPPDKLQSAPYFPHADKVLHATAFAALAIVASAAWTWRRRLFARDYLILLTALSAYAVLDELSQTLPGIRRNADPLDWLCDTAGAAVGLYVFAMLAGYARRRGLKLARPERSPLQDASSTD